MYASVPQSDFITDTVFLNYAHNISKGFLDINDLFGAKAQLCIETVFPEKYTFLLRRFQGFRIKIIVYTLIEDRVHFFKDANFYFLIKNVSLRIFSFYSLVDMQ